MTQFFTTSDGLRLAYDDQGQGHPLLCLAGLTRNMGDFETVLDTFRDKARIIRLDTRGRGQSDYDPTPANYDLVHEGNDALALMDHLGLEKVSILGTSRGGLISMVLGIEHAHRMHGVILNDIGPALLTSGLSHIMGYIGIRPPYTSYDDAADKLPGAMAQQFSNVPRQTWLDFARRCWVETPDGLDLRYDARLRDSFEDQPQGAGMPEIWPLFENLTARPLALIRGANSNLLSADTAAEMSRRAPDMIYGEVPDRGHVPFLDEPEAQAVISAYLETFA